MHVTYFMHAISNALTSQSKFLLLKLIVLFPVYIHFLTSEINFVTMSSGAKYIK